MREPQTRTIGAARYTVTPLPAGQGLALLTRLAKLLAPALAAAPSLAAMGDVAGDAIAGLLANVTEGDVEHLCAALKKTTMVAADGGEERSLAAVYDVHFQGDYLALFEWVQFALEVNYARFFDGVQAKLAGRKAPAASAATTGARP